MSLELVWFHNKLNYSESINNYKFNHHFFTIDTNGHVFFQFYSWFFFKFSFFPTQTTITGIPNVVSGCRNCWKIYLEHGQQESSNVKEYFICNPEFVNWHFTLDASWDLFENCSVFSVHPSEVFTIARSSSHCPQNFLIPISNRVKRQVKCQFVQVNLLNPDWS